MKILTKGNYYGSQNGEKSFNGILLSEYDYLTPRTDWHYHENPYFMYVLRGNMKDCNTRKETLCPAGSLMFNNWQEEHYGSKHSLDAGGFHLEFEKKWFDDNDIDSDLFEGSRLIQNPKVHLLFAKLYYEFKLQDDYSPVTVELLLLQISETISKLTFQDKQSIPPWVEHLKELLHYDNSSLSLQYLAEQLNIHPVHISRAVPKYFSMSLGEYIRQNKIKKTIPLLLNKDQSLTSIAYDVGFSDQSHFNRVFKSAFDMNPSLYRKNIK